MRQIKSFILSIKRLFELSPFIGINRWEVCNEHIRVCKYVDRILIRHLKSRNQITFSTSTEHYVNFCLVQVVKFGSREYESSEIDLNVQDKTDYFNYTVQNDPGRLTLDDIAVLNEIRDLAIKVLNNETSVH